MTGKIWCIVQANEVQQSVMQQQIHTWTLLFVLYTAIEDEPEVSLPDKPSLPEMLRRECLSSWLQASSWLFGSVLCHAVIVPGRLASSGLAPQQLF